MYAISDDCGNYNRAFADKPQPTEASPSKSELLKWKEKGFDKYKHVANLNADYVPISEKNFLREVRERRAAFSMTTAPVSVERIILRLSGPEEIAKARSKLAP